MEFKNVAAGGFFGSIIPLIIIRILMDEGIITGGDPYQLFGIVMVFGFIGAFSAGYVLSKKEKYEQSEDRR